jgi:hypothetical protein
VAAETACDGWAQAVGFAAQEAGPGAGHLGDGERPLRGTGRRGILQAGWACAGLAGAQGLGGSPVGL